MSREIKFRAWDGDRMTNCGIQFNNTTGMLENKGNIALMQFTGLLDANGVEIYEGDILKYKPYYNLGHEDIFKVAAVEWGETGDSDGYSHCKHYEYTCGYDSLADVADSDYSNESYCEVIGNIYEHKHLLDEAK